MERLASGSTSHSATHEAQVPAAQGGPDTKQPHVVQGASTWAKAGLALLHGTKALAAQAIAFGVPIASRLIARELLEAAKTADQDDMATALILTGVALSTLVFDQTITSRATTMIYGWLTKKDGEPSEPVGRAKAVVVAVVPTVLSGALLVREGLGSTQDASVLAVDLASMLLGWRVGRLGRDVIQQGVAKYLPKLTIVDADTGKPLTHKQKKIFDDTRLGYQLAGYTAVVFIGAFVTTPALRGYLGSDERQQSTQGRALAMLAPAINSVMVEFFDDVFSPFVQSLVAPRQDLVVKVDDGERPKDLAKAMLDQGAMRVFMGVFVTDVAQLILSIDRGDDFVKALGTAIGSVAIGIMEIRAKSVGVQSNDRDRSRAYKDLTIELIRSAQFACGRKFTKEQKTRMRQEMTNTMREFMQQGLAHGDARKRLEKLTKSDLVKLARTAYWDTKDGSPNKDNKDKHYKAVPQALAQASSTFTPTGTGPLPHPPQGNAEVRIDVQVPRLPSRPAITELALTPSELQPLTVQHPSTPVAMSNSDIPLLETKNGRSAPGADSEPPMHFHTMPMLPPFTPWVERESGASLPVCELLDASGTAIEHAADAPKDQDLTVRANGAELVGRLAPDMPSEPGFVYLRIPFALHGIANRLGELSHRLADSPLVKVKIAEIEKS